MAGPKGKISKARKNSRRANWKLSAPSIEKCPRCQKMKLSHRICRHCGYYDGRDVLNLEAKKAAKEKKEA